MAVEATSCENSLIGRILCVRRREMRLLLEVVSTTQLVWI
jgi:hypothetical protein